MTYRHGLSSFAVQSADQRDGGFNLYKLQFVKLFRGRVLGDFHRFGGVSTLFTKAIWNRDARFGQVHIARNVGFTYCEIRSISVHVNLAFPALCARFAILGN